MARRVAMVGLAAWLLGAAAPGPDLAAERARLIQARRDSAAAQARATRLEAQAKAERDEAARAKAEEAAVAARIAAAQDDIRAAEARISLVDERVAAQRTRLATGEAPAARLLGALQALTMRPAIVAVVQPGSVDDLVHVRAVLGAALPVVRARTASVRADLAETRRLRQDALIARQTLADSQAQLAGQREKLARLQAQHEQRSTQLARTALTESDRAIALGERARDIVDRMDVASTSAETGTELARLPGPVAREGSDAPQAPAAYRLPVQGHLLTGFGEISSAGVRARGLTFAVAPRAQVVAPAPGRIAYAARFRGYGVVVIVDHGQGWTTAVTGLSAAQVRVGEAVEAGALIGTAPASDDAQVTVELRRRGRAVDMTPLLG